MSDIIVSGKNFDTGRNNEMKAGDRLVDEDGNLADSPNIEDFQEGSGPHQLTSDDFGKTITNRNATALVEFDLPAVLIEDGPLTFVVKESVGIQVNLTNTGDIIRVGSLTSTAGSGTLSSSNIGDVITIVGSEDGVWQAVSGVGDWDVL